MSTRPVGKSQCHICDDLGVRCTAEVADPLQHRGMCSKHLAEAMQYVIQLQARIAQRENAS